MNKVSPSAFSFAAALLCALAACKPTQAPTPPERPLPTAASSPKASELPPAPAGTPTPASTPPPSASAPTLSDPVARVNGEAISRKELEDMFNQALQARGMKADNLSSDQKLEGYRQLLDEMILEKLVSKAAAGEPVSQQEIDAEIAKIKAQFPSEEVFANQLSQAGQTSAEFGGVIKKMIQQQHWIDKQLAGKTEVTDAEARKFYDENKEEFQEPDTVKASHILFLVSKEDPEAKAKEKLDAAKKAAARAKKGEDFTALAKELSEEPGAKESGGDLGYFPKDRMVPEFAEAAFAQKPGDVGDPVRTQYGWHVIKVTDKKPAGMVPYDQVKDQLITYLKTERQRKAVQDLLDTLRGQAKIENTLPAPPQPPAQPAAGSPAGE